MLLSTMMGRRNALVCSLLIPLLLPPRGNLVLAQGEYMMTMDEFNSILMTETPVDFGTPLTTQEGNDRWGDATRFQWSYNKVDRSAEFGDSFNFAPYIVCSSVPGLSGNERFDAVYQLLEDAAVDLNSVIFESDSVYNDDDKTCRLLSAEASLFKTVIESENAGENLEYLQIQPHYTSMKMIEGTFDDLAQGMVDVDCTGICGDDTDGAITVVSAGGTRLLGRKLDEYYLTGESMSLVISLTPVVLHFTRTGESSYEEIIQSMLEFVTGNGGMNVAEASYYVNATLSSSEPNTAAVVVSDRMEFYSNVVANVTSLTDPATGANVCLDKVLTNDVKIEQITGNETIGVIVETIGGELTEQELDDCLWFLVHAAMVHPYVASIESEAVIIPLPDEDTSGAHTTSMVTSAGLAVVAAAAAWISGLLPLA